MATLFVANKLKPTPENPEHWGVQVVLYPDGRLVIELQTEYEAMSEELEPDETTAFIAFLGGATPPSKKSWRRRLADWLQSLLTPSEK